jgi:hypothetical protein
MPVDLLGLHDRVDNAIALVDVTFLNQLGNELYHLDVCRITVLRYFHTFRHNQFSKSIPYTVTHCIRRGTVISIF